MIFIVTYTDTNPISKKPELRISHGVDSETLENICLPPERLDDALKKGWVSKDIFSGEYVMVPVGFDPELCRGSF